jgi:hypothetical protein
VLAREMATAVVAPPLDLPVTVVCDDPEVRGLGLGRWAPGALDARPGPRRCGGGRRGRGRDEGRPGGGGARRPAAGHRAAPRGRPDRRAARARPPRRRHQRDRPPRRLRLPLRATDPAPSSATRPRHERLGLAVEVSHRRRPRLGRRRARRPPPPRRRRPRRHPPRPADGPRPRPVPARALAVGAHPDDVEFGAGATLAKWAEAGCEVSLVICTDGSKGTWDPSADTAAWWPPARPRRGPPPPRSAPPARWCSWAGSTASWRTTGPPARRSPAGSAVLRPDVLLGHDPWKRYRLHPDHRAAGFLTVRRPGGGPRPALLPRARRGPPPPGPRCCCSRPTSPTTPSGGRASPGRPKIAALEAHRSQYESTMFITADIHRGGGPIGACPRLADRHL